VVWCGKNRTPNARWIRIRETERANHACQEVETTFALAVLRNETGTDVVHASPLVDAVSSDIQ
jgi:hypothetical protein